MIGAQRQVVVRDASGAEVVLGTAVITTDDVGGVQATEEGQRLDTLQMHAAQTLAACQHLRLAVGAEVLSRIVIEPGAPTTEPIVD